MAIRIGILGYGNLGRGVECAIAQNKDTELKAVFTRRNPESVSIKTAGVPVLSVDEAEKMKDDIDVMILCGGSATDLPVQTPQFASMFNVIDSFDTHAQHPGTFRRCRCSSKSCRQNRNHLRADGIRVCFHLTVYMLNASCRTARITHSGAKGSARDIPMQSAESKASSMRDNIRFR